MKTEKEIGEEITRLIEERNKFDHHGGMRDYIEFLNNRIVTLQWVLGVVK